MSRKRRGQSRTMVVCDTLQHAQLMPQHVELDRGVEAMLSSKQGGQPCLDISLLVEQLADGEVQI
jgi:hypothetical protein